MHKLQRAAMEPTKSYQKPYDSCATATVRGGGIVRRSQGSQGHVRDKSGNFILATGSPPKVHQFFRLVGPIVMLTSNEIG